MSTGYRHLRVEESTAVSVVVPTDTTPEAQVVQQQAGRTLDEWRKLAVQTGERLQYAENQLKDLREAADEARARVTKSKGRLDSAQARINDLQTELVRTTAERDDLRDRVSRMDVIKRKVYEYRQSLIDGPIWDIFAEL